MTCGYTDMKNISVSVDPITMKDIETIKQHIGRDNRSWAICEAIRYYAKHIESNKMDTNSK